MNQNPSTSDAASRREHLLMSLLFEQLLQFHVATYMDNDIAGIPQALQKCGCPVKAIRARLKGKEGRLRGNLMGKRVEFSARTVITGDPNLEQDEVGVPKSIAMTLTYPEHVTPYNIAYLQELVRNGPTAYPGARYVVRDTRQHIDLRYNKRADAFLQYGWIVERHLKDGDFVLFNRQPSLHKMSMMSHRVCLMPYSTFHLNLSVTPPYNADFDGDEMNMHLGAVTDYLPAGKQAGHGHRAGHSVQNILLWVPDWDGTVPIPAIIKPKPMWTGKQILSMVIPRGINIQHSAEPKSANPLFDDGMLIENGEIVFGIIERRPSGPEATRTLFTGLQQVVNSWLFHHGFSIGIRDTIADKKTMAYITQHIAERKTNVQQIIIDATHNRIKAAPGMTIRKSFESPVERELNLAHDTSGQYEQKNVKEDNNVKQMVVAGSKSVEGRRIPFDFPHRTLPHFAKDDYSPEARGFHPTPLVKALEHVMVNYDGTVRNSLGHFIQFVYGEDGMDGAFIEHQHIDTFSLNSWEFKHNYRVDIIDPHFAFLPSVLQIGIDNSSPEL
ncbi:hypothetical protein EVG20_g9946 [Dentipellis fragilis]|uniref:DNA-directed RNA polymerase subunit n=1 Tax=Dentipellis fragilis TaxID=205917 RepID=A0A4Y9XXH3_9AGAM|nr:hypothetical protein EVG20_g9946 [Dentipellis fragilis]